LLLQFRSFTQPLIILLTIPLSAIGSFLGLYFFGFDLSFVAMLGIVSLLGIVVNNAIVLMDFINFERLEGKSVKIACVDAGEKRFRPILLTTITTVIGLVPLVLSGSAMFVPMSVALMSGLMVSTLLTLIVIPMVYLWTHRDETPMTEEANKVQRDLDALRRSIYGR
jgi:multidrug efflux pump subunit AcrB